MQRFPAIVLVVAFSAVALAGCAGDDGPPPAELVDKDTFQLQAGKGAIAGLLVDDRFRPIQLTDTPQTEFQARGFILLQETGQQTQTNENGEFTFVDLDPGTYTLRVTADGHEAVPQSASVDEGVFNEVNVLARRVSSIGSSILTQEYSVFVACAVEAVVVAAATIPCLGDLSEDSERFDFWSDYRDVQNETTAVITEASFNNPGSYGIVVRYFDDEDCPGALSTCYFAETTIFDSDYVKITNIPGEVNEVHNREGRNVEFGLADEFQTAMFAYSMTRQTFNDAGFFAGAGAAVGVQARFVQSVFIGPPEQDLGSYCVMC